MHIPAFVTQTLGRFQRHPRTTLIIVASLIAFFIAGHYIIENIARHTFNQKCQELQEQKGVRIEFDSFGIRFFSTLELHGLRIIPASGDTLLSATHIATTLNIIPLISKRIDISRLEAYGVQFRPIHRDDYCNYSFLTDRRSTTTEHDSNNEPLDFSQRLHQLFRVLFGLLPSSLEIHSWDSTIDWKGNISQFRIEHLTSKRNKLTSQIALADSSGTQHININGLLNKRQRALALEIQSTDGNSPIRIPFLKEAFQATVLFNSLTLSLEVDRMNASRCEFHCAMKTNNLSVTYWRLADTTIVPGNLEIAATCLVEKNRAELAEGSSFSFNGFALSPKMTFVYDQKPKLTLLIDQQHIDAQQLINALPHGLFSTLETIQIKGSFDYRLFTNIDFAQPDSLTLEAGITNDQTTITQPGLLDRLSGNFTHRVYNDSGIEVAAFNIGSMSHSHNLKLNEISPLLQNAILQSEDGNFYAHKGFSEKHFREAMIENMRQHRFVRGGSTISMQLVKNLFLNKNKNVFRKVEEMALTWLIENKKIASKQRLFELYLNIIEWGPSIYGVREASNFYFAKAPSELTLDEALFMACIIPNPKKFYWWFDTTGQIKENRIAQMQRLAWLTTRYSENPIAPEEFVPSVLLRGRAADFIRQAPSDFTTEEENALETNELQILY